jgi:hypothetical protein
MKSLIKFSLLFIVITLIPITDTYAILATAPHAASSVMSNNLGKKLTWRERIALKVIKWQMGKTMQNYAVLDTNPSVSCSKIVLKNGKTIEANINQISKTEVKYRRCGFPSDPEMIESKDDISVVLASDGGALFVNDGRADTRASTSISTPISTPSMGNLETEPSAITSIIEGGLAWLLSLLGSGTPFLGILAILGAIASIVFGIVSLGKIRKEPQKYGGKGLAITGIILGSLFLLLVMIGAAAILA